MFWILLPENRSQNNNFFFTRIFNLSFNGLAYNTREHCVHCKRHFHRRNQGVSEYSYQRNGSNNFFCSGIINLLFDGLAYNTSGHFAHFFVFFLAPAGLGENTTQLAKYPHVLYAKRSNKVYVLEVTQNSQCKSSLHCV